MKAIAYVFIAGIFASSAWGAVRGKSVEYTANGVTFHGYVAYDDAISGRRPGVLVVHEWWGHNQYARKRADMLAELGYVALAVDMYGDGKQANHPSDAGKFAGEVMKNIDGAKARFLAALELLKKNPNVDQKKTAAIGYCFGGGVVLNMARMGVDVDGIVSFHGSLDAAAKAKKGEIKTRILVCNGGADSFVSDDQISAFKKEMDDLGVDYKFVSYDGAKHAFTNPAADEKAREFKLDLAYNAKADKDSWRDMRDFLQSLFE